MDCLRLVEYSELHRPDKRERKRLYRKGHKVIEEYEESKVYEPPYFEVDDILNGLDLSQENRLEKLYNR